MNLTKFNKFLKTVDLQGYRKKYSHIRITEMDLDKNIQVIVLLYRIYWDGKKFISFDDFYKKYLGEKKKEIEKFRVKTTMCKDCFYRGLEARIYRTWAGLITQIHAGYVAESVFGKGTVSMSEELDRKDADIRVEYKGYKINYQIKKTSYKGVRSAKIPPSKKLDGESIGIFYEVPNSSIFANPKRRDGKFRVPYLRFMRDKRTKRLDNGFVVFTRETFLSKKKEIDSKMN